MMSESDDAGSNVSWKHAQVARLARQLPTGNIQMVQLGPDTKIKTDDLDADDLT